MRKYYPVFLRVFSNWASVASILALLLVFTPPAGPRPWWATLLIVISVFLAILFAVLEVAAVRHIRIFDKAKPDKINRYMCDWIRHGGRVAIWSRDMSWAREDPGRALLMEKAIRGELILCQPTETEFTRELEEAGAEVCLYGADVLESPLSRFTITHFGQGGSQVAIGHSVEREHIVREFDSQKDPAFFVARDLIEFARKSLR